MAKNVADKQGCVHSFQIFLVKCLLCARQSPSPLSGDAVVNKTDHSLWPPGVCTSMDWREPATYTQKGHRGGEKFYGEKLSEAFRELVVEGAELQV